MPLNRAYRVGCPWLWVRSARPQCPATRSRQALLRKVKLLLFGACEGAVDAIGCGRCLLQWHVGDVQVVDGGGRGTGYHGARSADVRALDRHTTRHQPGVAAWPTLRLPQRRNDNKPWCYACNDNDSAKPAIAVLLEWLHSLQSIYSFRMYLDWIPSAENPIADAVSREEWSRFYAVAAANNYPPSALRRVQMLPRSSIVSLMISMKRSAKRMLPPP